MIGPVEYIGGALIAATVAYGGYQRLQVSNLETAVARLELSEARARGSLATCNARLTNIHEAEKSNAAIPDDLGDFIIPDSWMLGTSGTDPAPD